MNQTPSEGRVQLHSPRIYQFLEQVATQSVTPQEVQEIRYQRVCIARKKSLKKVNNLEAAIRGKLQELEHESELVKQYDQFLSQMEPENQTWIYWFTSLLSNLCFLIPLARQQLLSITVNKKNDAKPISSNIALWTTTNIASTISTSLPSPSGVVNVRFKARRSDEGWNYPKRLVSLNVLSYITGDRSRITKLKPPSWYIRPSRWVYSFSIGVHVAAWKPQVYKLFPGRRLIVGYML